MDYGKYLNKRFTGVDVNIKTCLDDGYIFIKNTELEEEFFTVFQGRQNYDDDDTYTLEVYNMSTSDLDLSNHLDDLDGFLNYIGCRTLEEFNEFDRIRKTSDIMGYFQMSYPVVTENFENQNKMIKYIIDNYVK